MTTPTRLAERVVLVGVGLKSEARSIESSLSELRRLAETAGAVVAGETRQALGRYHPGTLIGEGKIAEVAETARALRAATVIFDAELSPAQQKSLEKLTGAKIIDRTRLILDIFAKRARTAEGRLQVELAQLSYLLPRLTGAWRAFSQQVGGIGTRGPGERKIEYERRHIQNRITHLKEELEKIKGRRLVQRQRRLGVPVPMVAIIGYTNVGKSTLLNALLGSADPRHVYADDKLFATLDATTRRIRLPDGSRIVATDTVGFIQRLPTTLVAAFRSTLEEAALADCLLIVSDATAQDSAAQDRAVDEVLDDLGAGEVARVRVFNKADLLSQEERRGLALAYPGRPLISAETGSGLKAALEAVVEKLSAKWLLRELELPHAASRLSAAIYASAQVIGTAHHGTKVRYRLRVTAENWERLRSIGAREHLLH
ncbi:MAG: GTPase HflX [Elusimicrobia bacterium]|nr:GTPase HflX [Elusimicrobiota bacterium]